jgi:hypothetical protein
MVELSEGELFGSDEYSQRRSILFAIVLAAGFLAVAAGAGTIATGSNIVVGAVLLVVGVLSLGGGAMIATGNADEYLFE